LPYEFNLYAFPDTVLLYALPEIEELCIDLNHLQQKRDFLGNALRGQGYELQMPEGAWYLLPKSPVEDDLAFTRLLAEKEVFVLPGSIVELPGYFRISLTANDEMIKNSLAVFDSAIKSVGDEKTISSAAF
jgi:aspartate aminotransferase